MDRSERDMERREHDRFAANGKLRIDFAIDNKVKIKNIGTGGICLETMKNIKNNEIYSMRLFDDINDEMMLTGVVVRSFLRRSITANSNIYPVYEVALQFNALNMSDVHSLEKFIHNYRV